MTKKDLYPRKRDSNFEVMKIELNVVNKTSNSGESK